MLHQDPINDNNERDEQPAGCSLGEVENDFEVILVNNSRNYVTSLNMPRHYIGYIKGKMGATKMRIETETKTMIKIPKQGHHGDISIIGTSVANVKAARRQIRVLIFKASRDQKGPTHFVSIPMNTPDIMSNFKKFKEQVLKEISGRGIEECIFTKTEELHLTIGVMHLMDNGEKMAACKLLDEAKEKIILPMLREHSPLRIRVKGISYMNDDPYQIHVLYATVSEENGGAAGVLQTLANQLVDYYYKAGYMDRYHNREHVKLHVTLMNSRYRKPSDDVRMKRQVPFDGSQLLERFADFDFGVLELTELHLSESDLVGDNGYYQPTCIVSWQ